MVFDLDSKNYELLPNNVLYTGKAILSEILFHGEGINGYFSLKFIIKDMYYTIHKWTVKYLEVPEFATNCANNLMKAIRDNCSEDYTKRLLEDYTKIENPLEVCFNIIQQIQDNKLKLKVPINIYFRNRFRQIDLYPACCQGDAT